MPGPLLTPVMTSLTAPTGTVDADSWGWYTPADGAWRWFTHTADPLVLVPYDYYLGDPYAAAKTPPHWLSYTFDTPTEVGSFQFHFSSGTPQRIITDLKFQALDGAGWIDLLTVTGISGTQGTWSDDYKLDSTGLYSSYRLLLTDWVDDPSTNPDLVRMGGLALYGITYEYTAPALDLNLVFSESNIEQGVYGLAQPLQPNFNLKPATVAIGPVSISVPVISMPFGFVSPAMRFDLDANLPTTIVYRITLTGSPDLVLPVSSLQMRLRASGQNFVSVVVPDGNSYATDIIANTAGDLVIERGVEFSDGTQQLVEIARVVIDDVRDDGGGRNRSITITGHAAVSPGSKKEIELTNVTYRGSTSTGRRFRAALDLNLRANDTAIVGNESIIVDMITYIVSAKGETMEISEAI